MRVLLLAPYYDRNTPGESWSTYKWVEGISQFADVTVLTQHKKGWDPQSSLTNATHVVNWDEPVIPGMQGRIAWELKPGYIWYYLRAKRWIQSALKTGQRFDLIHQINPLALRYPSPAQGHGVRYIIGPLAGSLPTPAAFLGTNKEKQWYRKLRGLDHLRIKFDPLLRSTYKQASCVLGVAPYVAEMLAPCKLQRFETMSETGVETVSSIPKERPNLDRPIRFLFVGRLIRTKGVIEAIEAINYARGQANIQFNIIGDGELAQEARSLVQELSLGDIVHFHGRLDRGKVFEWYENSDVFLFPSYREPSGNVVFEAMSKGLPVITSAYGGPGYVVNNECGETISSSHRPGFINALAHAIIRFSTDRDSVPMKSLNCLHRMRQFALWNSKITSTQQLYQTLLLNS